MTFSCFTSTWAMSATILMSGFFSAQAQAQLTVSTDDFHDKLLQIGTAPEGGSFEPIGNTLCDVLNEVRKKNLIRCVTKRTAGSVFNIHAVANGSLQLGFSQEDLLAEAFFNGDIESRKKLRAVALVHNSFIGIMVRSSSGITNLSQIKSSIVNKGKKGSGTFVYSTAVLKALNLEERDLAGVTFLENNDLESYFCSGKVDVFIHAIAHPSNLYKRLRACGGEFLDIPPDISEKMLAQNSWLKQMNIPAGLYDADQKQVNTLGVRNLLISNAEVDEEAIFRLSNLIFQKYKTLQEKQPYLASMRLLVKEDVNSLALPLHPGALRALEMSKP